MNYKKILKLAYFKNKSSLSTIALTKVLNITISVSTPSSSYFIVWLLTIFFSSIKKLLSLRSTDIIVSGTFFDFCPVPLFHCIWILTISYFWIILNPFQEISTLLISSFCFDYSFSIFFAHSPSSACILNVCFLRVHLLVFSLDIPKVVWVPPKIYTITSMTKIFR